jgi:hypothetical protein
MGGSGIEFDSCVTSRQLLVHGEPRNRAHLSASRSVRRSMVAIDSEYSLSFVTHEEIERWGVSEEEVWLRAYANFSSVRPGVASRDPSSGLFHLAGPDSFQSSLLLRRDFSAVITDSFGPVVFVAVGRDDVFALATQDRQQLARHLAVMLEDWEQNPRQLSPVPYTYDENDDLVVWRPLPDDPCFPVVDKAIQVLAKTEYNHQQGTLQRHNETQNVDLYVAGVDLIALPNQPIFSWSMCLEAIGEGLLPETDRWVFSGNTPGDVFEVAFEDVQRVAGQWFPVVPGMTPKRFLHHGWPPPEVMQQLRELAFAPRR